MRGPRKAAGAVVLLVAAAWLVQAQTPPEFPVIGKNLEPLRADFNRDAGKVRLLLLLDPT